MAKHRDQGGCENFDGEPHTIAQCLSMAARIGKRSPVPPENFAGDEHGPRPHYHVGQGTTFPVFYFTGEEKSK